jgi:DNA-binding MarR family transcriptional regulator
VSSERPIRRTGDVAVSAEPSSEDIRVHIALRLKKDDLELAVGQLNRDRRNAPCHTALCKLACRIYDARREREKMLDRKLFGEPGWDMLLALYCLPTRGERLGVTALSGASAVSLTTALRWQATLLEDGLIERIPDEADARREFVRLTDKGRCMLEDYLLWLYQTGGLESVVD